MVTMHIMRMLAEMSFFYAIAGLIAARCGGSGAFAGFLLQCVCFGLSSLGGDKRLRRLAFLLPMAAGWFLCRGSAADGILMIPPAAYIVWLVWKDDYELEQGRHRRLFTAFCRVIFLFSLLMTAVGFGADVRTVVLPYAALMLTTSVLLMRSLRHDAAVYCKPSYQLVNLSAVALATLAAILLSTKTALAAYRALLKALYNTLILPVLTLLLRLLLEIMFAVEKLLKWLGVTAPELDEVKLDDEAIDEMLEQINGMEIEAADASGLRTVLIVLGIAAAALILVLFFRWLNQKKGGSVIQAPSGTTRVALAGNDRRENQKETSPVRTVRNQYRKFLKLCAARGAAPKKHHTSLDMEEKARYALGANVPTGEIRDIYILARYDGKADQDSVRRIKKLYSEAKKAKEANDF